MNLYPDEQEFSVEINGDNVGIYKKIDITSPLVTEVLKELERLQSTNVNIPNPVGLDMTIGKTRIVLREL